MSINEWFVVVPCVLVVVGGLCYLAYVLPTIFNDDDSP